MSIRPIILSLSILCASSAAMTPAYAQSSFDRVTALENTAQTKSFSELEALLRLHPSLDALGFSALADRERADSALGLPDPAVSIGLNNFPVFSPSLTEYLPTHKYVGVKQSIPNRAKRQAGSLKSLRQAAQTDMQKERQFAVLRSELIRLLIERDTIRQLRKIAELRSEKYKELTEIIEIEINSGRPVVFRLAEVDIERTEVARTLARLDGDETDVNARFIDLVGLIPETAAPAISVKPWTGHALSFYAVAIADAQVEIMDAGVQKAEADFKPDWGLNLTYQQRESGRGAPRSNFDGDDWVSGGVSFTVPLWADKKQQPNLRAAKHDRSAAMSRRMAVSRRVLSDWKRLQSRRDLSIENIKILETKITAIKDQIASTLITYETGRGDYSPIIDGEIAILKLRAQIVSEAAMRDGAAAQMNSLLKGATS